MIGLSPVYDFNSAKSYTDDRGNYAGLIRWIMNQSGVYLL